MLVSVQYGGTRTVREGYTFDVAHQIGEGTYGQVFVGNCKKDKVKVGVLGFVWFCRKALLSLSYLN